eukprot:GHVP01029534.1.p1 GENE.GHVP01029534.1~~GHVP01029534.1.p1  ORF type:complete len:349 (+),score=48.59 GHVP01029534.1:109-1155(+)
MGIKNREIITAAGVQTILNIFQNKVIDLKCNDLPPDNVAVENYKFSTVSPVAQNQWKKPKWKVDWKYVYEYLDENLREIGQSVSFGKTPDSITPPSQEQLTYFDKILKDVKLFTPPRELKFGSKTRSLYSILGILLDDNKYVSSLTELHKIAKHKKCRLYFRFIPDNSVCTSWKFSAYPIYLVKAFSGEYFPEWEFTCVNDKRSKKESIHPSIHISDTGDGIDVEIMANKNFSSFCLYDLQEDNPGFRRESEKRKALSTGLIKFAENNVRIKEGFQIKVKKVRKLKTEKVSGITSKDGNLFYKDGDQDEHPMGCLYYKDRNRRSQKRVDSSSISGTSNSLEKILCHQY